MQPEIFQPESKTDNTGNKQVYRVSGIIRRPEGLNGSVCISNDDESFFLTIFEKNSENIGFMAISLLFPIFF